MRIIDLTHPSGHKMPVYPGDPEPSLEQVAFIEKDTYNDHRLTTVMHVGTHMDAPLHMIPGGKKMAEISPDKFIGDGVVIDVRGKNKIDVDVLAGKNIVEDSILLLYTGLAKDFQTEEYFTVWRELTEDFARKMVELKVKIVGMDMAGPDIGDPWVTHKILLGEEILIIENLANLDQLLKVDQFQIIALPPKLEADAAPVRVIAIVD